jgi:glycosyltransferase involved in cell wall biosynthesis
MACEVPVISTNTGGLKEVNIDGVTGFTSDVGDTTKMAKDALHILKEENLSQFKSLAKMHSLKFKLDTILPIYEKTIPIKVYFSIVNITSELASNVQIG